MRSSSQLLVVIAVFGTDVVVRAQDEAQVQDWPRFHIGGAFGETDLEWDWSQSGLPERFWSNETTDPDKVAKVVVGFRPVRVVGVEIQYIDFDEADMSVRGRLLFNFAQGGTFYDQHSYMKADADAWVLSALLFIPEPSPSFDVYGKAGVADFDESFVANAYTLDCAPISQCIQRFHSDVHQSDAELYVGIGARFKIAPAVAVRVEYEAIDREGDPATMLSVGIAWEH